MLDTQGEFISQTMDNLREAFAGESQAHTKYRYFAKIAREEGHEDIAKHFEHTADQEILHSWSHLELIIGKPTTKECLEMAIAGETEEFTHMYPRMATAALNEGDDFSFQTAQEQIEESKEHAEQFQAILDKAQKRFSALSKIEKRHAAAYQQILEKL